MAKTFLWIEDRKGKASYTFWENLMKQLCPDVIVESKKNNSELVKAVRALQDAENRYIIGIMQGCQSICCPGNRI